MSALYDLAGAVHRFMEAGPSLLTGLLLLAVAAGPVTLVHEVGHVLVARWRLTGALFAHAHSGLVRDVLWALTLDGVFGVLNLVPLTIEERRRQAPLRTDGRLALDAVRAVRAWR